MKINDLENYGSARYTENIPNWFGNLEFVSGTIENDYQGSVELVGTNGEKYYSLSYSYGSCSGCDAWESENLSSEQIEKEISDLIVEYSKEEYEKLLERLKENK